VVVVERQHRQQRGRRDGLPIAFGSSQQMPNTRARSRTVVNVLFLLLVSLVLVVLGARREARAAASPVRLPARLTLDEALRIFREHGLDLIIAEAAVDSAEGDVTSAGAVANPALGLSFTHAFTYRPDSPDPASSCSAVGATCTSNGVGVALSDQNAIEDSLSGKRGLRLRVARAALAAARMGRADARRNLEFQVKAQYLQAVLARDQLDFAVEAQGSTTRTFELTKVRYAKGAISEADEAKAETAKLEADQAVTGARRSLDVARLGLAYLLGVRGAVPAFDVDADLPAYVVPPRLRSATPDSLLREALDHRPDLEGQRFQRARADGAAALARRLRFPDIALGIGYQQAGSGGMGTNAPLTPPTLTVGVTAPLPLLYQQQGEIRKADADRKVQEAQQAKIEALVAADVGGAYANFASARELVERMQARLLERARRARDLVAVQYDKGAASLLELLDAERVYIGTNVEYLNDLAAYWAAVYQVEQAVGEDLTR
jgi:cobalt-zinc-cadmium efflux system outer membrane protein